MAEIEDLAPENAKFYYVYILRCHDGDLYTGCTHNLKERFHRHQQGWVPITKARRPVQLLWCCAFPDRSKAFDFEKYLKPNDGVIFDSKDRSYSFKEVDGNYDPFINTTLDFSPLLESLVGYDAIKPMVK